jgi:hypothetical protein
VLGGGVNPTRTAIAGVLAPGEQAGVGIAQDPVEIGRRRVEDRGHARRGETGDQAGVVLQHLLVVRNAPVLRRGVAEETAGYMVVRAAARHLLQRVDRHLAELIVSA